jgi:uncharacterized membrane protein YkvA (DUF1232 family)
MFWKRKTPGNDAAPPADASEAADTADTVSAEDMPLVEGGQGRGESYKALKARAERAELPPPRPGDAARVRSGFLQKLARTIGRVPFVDDVTAAYFAAMDPATPVKAKATLLAALAYFIMPADVVPDFIAGLGFTDDATVLATAIAMVGGQIRPEHRDTAGRLLGLPENAT